MKVKHFFAGFFFGQSRDLQIITRFDDHAPASPDESGSREGSVLGQREFLYGALKVGDTRDDETPLP